MFFFVFFTLFSTHGSFFFKVQHFEFISYFKRGEACFSTGKFVILEKGEEEGGRKKKFKKPL